MPDTLATPAIPNSRRNAWRWAGVAIVLLAAGLRLCHIDFDLPEVHDVDAGKFVDPAVHIVQSGELKPYDFQYPRGYVHALAIIYKIFGIKSDYATHLTARLLSVCGGLGMVGAAWLLATRMGGALAGCVAALLTAISVECVTTSHVACTDTLTACFASLALAVAVAPAPNWRTWAAAGLFVGFATGMKFSGACVAPAVLLPAIIHAVRARRPGLAARDAGIVCLAALVALLTTTPRFLVDLGDYVARLRYEGAVQRFGQFGHVQYGWFDYLFSMTTTPEQPWLYTSLLVNIGPLLLAVAGIAIVAALVGRAGQAGVIVALYTVGYLALISGPGHLKAIRFLLLVMPALYALVGWLVERVVTRLPVGRGRVLASTAMTLALAAWPAYRTANYLALLRQPATNTLLRAWVRENIPAGATIFASPFYVGDLWALPIHALTFYDTWERQYRLPESVGPSAERTPIFIPQVVDVMQQKKVEYVVLNSYFDDGLAPTTDNLRWFPVSVEAYRGFRAALEQRADRVHTVTGYAEGRSGPDVTIYRMRH